MPYTTLELTGKWEFKEYPLSARRMRDLDSAGWQQTSVPCSIFNSLINAGTISTKDINTRPENFTFVSEKPWIYKKTFNVPEEILNCDRVELVFDGLDTITSIWLNNKLIGKTNNMFIPFRFDVTKLLKPKENSLLVKFEPPLPYAKKLMSRYTSFSESDFTNPYRVYIRKAQYQFGWDFCPSLPGCGIWRPVSLQGTKKAALDDLHIRTINCNHKFADIKITLNINAISREEFRCRLILTGDDRNNEQCLTFEPGELSQSTVIHIKNPLLWFPAGYGAQNLYQLEIQLLSNDEIIDHTKKQFGIRTVKLNLAPDEHGNNFRFEVNGQPVFARGANWIPASIFAGSTAADDYQKLLHAAANANMNMLRIWGGGYYEADEFYRLCDRLGIMVWQDFMFACAYYPDRKWFAEEIKNEATEIIKRLRNHPCLVLWCGNNEIDWMHTAGKLGKSKKFYGKAIYHQLLPKLVAELDPDTGYIPTTPFSAAQKQNDPNSGTIHQWSVWSGNQPIRQYQCQPEDVPRFVTEFGLQSLPNMETVKNFCPQRHLRIGSRLVEQHNYQLDGNSRLYRYVGDLFGSAENLEQFAYLSQITQARAVKTYVEHLRAHNYKNNGVLFWQLNDCCPAISWSALDYNKEPKALYYYAKRFFSNVLIAVAPQLGKHQAKSPKKLLSLSVIAINDGPEPLTATLNCRLIDLFGCTLDQVAFPVVIAPFSTSAAMKLPKALTYPPEPQKSALHLLMEKDGKKISENLLFYLPDKYIDWPNVKIETDFVPLTKKKCRLTLKSNAIAKDVQIKTPSPARFSNNFIDLLPPQQCVITIDFAQMPSSVQSLTTLRSIRPARRD